MRSERFSFIRRREFDDRLAEAHAQIEQLRQEVAELTQIGHRAAELLDLVEQALLSEDAPPTAKHPE